MFQFCSHWGLHGTSGTRFSSDYDELGDKIAPKSNLYYASLHEKTVDGKDYRG